MAKRLTSISNQTDFNEDEIISAALQILERRITYHVDKPIIKSPEESKDYVKLQLAERPYEVFACLFLDSRHRVIAFEELFRGTGLGVGSWAANRPTGCLPYPFLSAINAIGRVGPQFLLAR